MLRTYSSGSFLPKLYMSLRAEWLQILTVLVVALVLLGRDPASSQRTIHVGQPGDQQYLDGIWQAEQNENGSFRWTNGAGIVWLNQYRSLQALIVHLRLSSPLASATAPTLLTLRADERDLGVVPISQGWRQYHLLVAPNGSAWRTANIDLISPTRQIGATDLRRLGIIISDVAFKPTDQWLLLPLAVRLFSILAVLVCIRALIRILVSDRLALAASAFVGCSIAVYWWLAPDQLDQFLPSVWHAALLLGLAAMLFCYSQRSAHARLWSIVQPTRSLYLRAVLVLILPVAVGVAATAVFSLQWRMLHDAPLLMYIAYLVDHYHAIPYRDIFDQNMPGAVLFYVLIGRVFGYDDPGFRIADILLLLILSILTWIWCARISRPYATVTVLLFAWLYFHYGPSIGMQRDFVLLIPVVGALVIAGSRLRSALALFLIGLLFGLAAVIKPHAIIPLPFVCWYVLGSMADQQQTRLVDRLRALSFAVVGLLIAPLVCTIYLYQQGGLTAFIEMVEQYLPLFAKINGVHQSLSGPERIPYLLIGYLSLGGHYLWLLAAAVGAYLALQRAQLSVQQKRQVLLAGGVAFAYSLYPIVQGRFWTYHWLPFIYALMPLIGLGILMQRAGRLILHVLPALLIMLAIIAQADPPIELSYQAIAHPLPPIKDGRVDQIARFLQANLRPGETVQPLDWTGGALHGMLVARARVATPFIYAFQFYHDVDTPYIQSLRQRFMTQMLAVRPRYVIDMGVYNTLITGEGSSAVFPALDQLLQHEYRVAFRGQGYAILEHR